MFFNSWGGVLRVVVVGILAYLSMVFLLRIAGKRTLSKMNAFDFIVTVALGSTLATVLQSKDVPLIEGVTAFVVLIVLQFVITWLSVRSKTISRLVKSEPAMLFYQGEYLWKAMKKARVVEVELTAVLRAHGIASVESVEAIVLETDGSFTVIPQPSQKGVASTLQKLSYFTEQEK
ncbi:MAG: DUF421 domain-containing protein [Anaerolineaceae bacterium]|jgi:uncharacterized membrane protein YcaP (DUF421 family)|nr:DUF421 domain-containing protein [Anaerolineaceae bacterium]